MKKCITWAALFWAAAFAHAADPAAKPSKAPTAQQALMGICNTDAAGKKGEARKEFMSTCLADGKKRQQARMKSCNLQAEGKKGDDRKAFMSSCLKKSS